MNLLESKLTYANRNKLQDKEFGLPSERKYPLNDKSHVLSAIKFFKFAKKNQRRELAKNINIKLNKYDMKVNVDKDNPFYKYIDRSCLNESVNIFDKSPKDFNYWYNETLKIKEKRSKRFYGYKIEDLPMTIVMQKMVDTAENEDQLKKARELIRTMHFFGGTEYFDRHNKITYDEFYWDSYDTQIEKQRQKIKNMKKKSVTESTINKNIFSEYGKIVYDIEKAMYEYLDEYVILEKEKIVYNVIKNTVDKNYEFNLFIKTINDLFIDIYNSYNDFMEYELETDMGDIYYKVLEDIIKSYRVYKIRDNTKGIKMVKNEFDNFLHIISTNKFNHNSYYIERLLAETEFDCQCKNLFINKPLTCRILSNVSNDITIFINNSENQHIYQSVKQKLLDKKLKLEETIQTLNYTNNNKPVLGYIRDIEDCSDKVKEIIELITQYNINMKYVLDYISDVEFNLNSLDEFRLLNNKSIDKLIQYYFSNGNTMFLAIKEDFVYIVSKSVIEDYPTYYLLLVDHNSMDHFIYGIKTKTQKITIRYGTDKEDKDFEIIRDILLEGIDINENGDIKVIINPDKSYMDEYAEAHRILKENYKNNNYDAMKDNVCFMFLLISVIERDNRYKDREPEIVKARAYAINDFKTYLKYIQEKEPDFNFEKYYRESGIENKVINIPKSSIVGIKNLLKIILM